VLLLLLHWVCSYSVLSVMLHLFPLGICKFKHANLVNRKLQNTLFYGQSKIEIASHCQTEIAERVLQCILKCKTTQATCQTKTNTTRIILSAWKIIGMIVRMEYGLLYARVWGPVDLKFLRAHETHLKTFPWKLNDWFVGLY